MLLWCILLGFALVVFWRDATQSQGMLLLLNYSLPLGVIQRLVPLAALAIGGIGFAAIVQATGPAVHAADLPGLVTYHWRGAIWSTIGIGIAGAMAVVWVLHAFPNSGDEYDYLFEAKTFLAGRLWNPIPSLFDLFAYHHILFKDGKWIAGYPPGWPLLLAATMGARAPPWLACPLAGALLLFAMFKLGQLRDGALGGVLAVALVALSPFFLFSAGSYFDLVPAAAAGSLFCWAALKFLRQPRLANAAASGLALGALGLIRNQDVLLFALPFAAEFLWKAGLRHYRLTPIIVLAGLPFLVALLLYYNTALGSPVPQTNLESQTVRFGLFPIDEFGRYLTPLDELRFVMGRIIMLGEWTSPLLVLGYLVAFGLLAVRHRLSFLDFIFPAYVLAFMLVPFDGGNQYGPRYYFEAFPFLVLTVVSGLVPLLHEIKRPRQVAFYTSLVLAHGAISIAGTAIFAVAMRTIVDQRMDIYDQVRAKRLRNAVVVVHSGTSPLRLMDPRDLTRNGIAVGEQVIYVLDIPDRLMSLHRLFPARRFYIYERAPRSPKGRLRPLS